MFKKAAKLAIIPVIILACFIIYMAAQAEDFNVVEKSKELFEEVQLFSDSLALISADYVKPVKIKDLIYGAIRGMIETLDGYSQFLDPESFREITEETEGQFGGVGIEIGVRDGILTVISAIEDTPAFKAGVKPGDMIVKIADRTTRNMTLDEAVDNLRGEAGTNIRITVYRKGTNGLLDFSMERAIIKLKSVKDAKIIEGDIAYVKLIEFQQRTASDLGKEVKRLVNDGAKSLILDLRNNPGGLLDAAIEASDYFLEPGKMIVYTEGRDPKKRVEFVSKRKSEFNGLKMAILINKGSASSSEIMAGALRDNKRAILIGVTTFGKGSIQTVIPLRDKSAVRITTASYFTPSGKNLMDKGIDPDIYVEYSDNKETPANEDVNAEKEKIFSGIDEAMESGEEGNKDEGKKERYDSQITAAINALKGITILEDFMNKEPEGKN